MRPSHRQLSWLLFLTLLCVMCEWLPVTVHATEEAETISTKDAAAAESEDEDVYTGDDTDGGSVMARAIFPNSVGVLSPTLPAGAPADALLSYRHQQTGHRHTVVLLAGYLAPHNTHGQVIQNFSIVRHARPVNPAETVSFQYRFTPDAMLEPNEYNLVLGLYYHDNITNNTFFVTAFNDTVTVDESLSADPKTLLTYITLLVLFGGVAYFVAAKVGLVAVLKGMRNGRSKGRRRVEVGTNGEGYDPDYITREHHAYRESVLQRNASSSPSKKKK
ncbi:Translocon-associated protein (TRAP) [Trypanosoma melophagium]|uniref:Translocon-associated protein (TRAP) n=1 Tax=Trypanosoma melophagium TaxID=715481 RepID=UPI00351A788B|nr:Translocon-associated protein (TRAP) [Trypanosoma melophagium]